MEAGQVSYAVATTVALTSDGLLMEAIVCGRSQYCSWLSCKPSLTREPDAADGQPVGDVTGPDRPGVPSMDAVPLQPTNWRGDWEAVSFVAALYSNLAR